MSIKTVSVTLLSCVLSVSLQAREVVSPDLLTATENAVFTDDGRYFVAGSDGIHEIRDEPAANCAQDFNSDLYVCPLVAPALENESCIFRGMTTDGTYLYASCAVHPKNNTLFPATRSALFRVLPGTDGVDELITRDFDDVLVPNGMAVGMDGSLYLSDTNASLGILKKTAIVKLTFTDETTLDFVTEPWLPASPLYSLPNGLQIDGDTVYFVGGHNLWKIKIRGDGSAGFPILTYHTHGVTKLMDDLVILPNAIAVAEFGLINGLGFNKIVLIKRRGFGFPRKILTGLTQLSSLAWEEGDLFTPGSFVGTSFLQGGLHEFERH
ncbi:hypothetical protein [Pseudoteredinibacter isoporae]|uniref:Sugar lactone lactonase YvrE n=1 Tax=Pseudoteredinibacter isoporae TaxID=570281 RepID=A0A7X0JSL6_9GAMM|nr:hypothetical protein [Pseudoteredinibacter isoporae]MBB6521502.1 sugar lactone lactonase YvrE [Pseudoteredinibacter isoporae]NHO87056.1 hypothetical protein [Pseudoteredinibacter isoporae]NIB22803.1 hypothetical protein [Pseudoteredinibacter isoporae]